MNASRTDKSISTTKNSTWQLLEVGDPFPSRRSRAGGDFILPGWVPALCRNSRGCWGDLSSDTFIWKNYCGCLQMSPQPLSQEFPVFRMRGIMEPVLVGRAASCCCMVDIWGSMSGDQPSDHEGSLEASPSWLWMESWREPPGFVVSRMSW